MAQSYGEIMEAGAASVQRARNNAQQDRMLGQRDREMQIREDQENRQRQMFELEHQAAKDEAMRRVQAVDALNAFKADAASLAPGDIKGYAGISSRYMEKIAMYPQAFNAWKAFDEAHQKNYQFQLAKQKELGELSAMNEWFTYFPGRQMLTKEDGSPDFEKSYQELDKERKKKQKEILDQRLAVVNAQTNGRLLGEAAKTLGRMFTGNRQAAAENLVKRESKGPNGEIITETFPRSELNAEKQQKQAQDDAANAPTVAALVKEYADHQTNIAAGDNRYNLANLYSRLERQKEIARKLSTLGYTVDGKRIASQPLESGRTETESEQKAEEFTIRLKKN